MRDRGASIGVLGITCFRPWPLEAVRGALARARRVIVLEKSLAVGLGGIVSTNVRTSYTGRADAVNTVIAGLGGRAITKASLARAFMAALEDRLAPLTFLDLDHALVERQLARERDVRRSGPIAENILRDLGMVAARLA
jgi:pyruvate ferredoxin oxidoreductase alpha subunit